MSKHNDGGAAYPSDAHTGWTDAGVPIRTPCDRGLTKRELFAAMAMQGMLGNANCTFGDAARCASEATRIADALLAELAREVSQ